MINSIAVCRTTFEALRTCTSQFFARWPPLVAWCSLVYANCFAFQDGACQETAGSVNHPRAASARNSLNTSLIALYHRHSIVVLVSARRSSTYTAPAIIP